MSSVANETKKDLLFATLARRTKVQVDNDNGLMLRAKRCATGMGGQA